MTADRGRYLECVLRSWFLSEAMSLPFCFLMYTKYPFMFIPKQ